jgi:hypothetical protein
MSWGLLIAPQSAAPIACAPAVRPRRRLWRNGPLSNGPLSNGKAILAFAILATMFGTDTAHAAPLHLPPVQVGAPPSCVDVQVQGERSLSFDCLNAKLKADAEQPTDAPPTVTAKDSAGNGAPNTVGTFSFTATSIRMGNSFGHSAIPQRPPAPSFSNALIPRAK